MTAKTTSAGSEYTFPRSASPAKEDLRANAHPYAIKTTSTGILSRSNSSPQHPPSHYKSTHHYVPNAPKKTERPARIHGHRYSRSLTSDSPRPLPAPPVSDSEDNGSPMKGMQRAETVPAQNMAPQSPMTPSEILPDDLPPNPKLWTPSQLATYLTTALRVKSGEALQLPKPVAKDIAQFVRESKITGRVFVRMTETDLEGYGISKPWCAALLAASRNLRHNVLKGRIWGFGNSSASGESEGDDEDTPNKRRRSQSTSSPTHHRNPFDSELYSSASSSSSLDLSTNSAMRGHYRNGRVKGMVASFERSSSMDEDFRPRRERSDSTTSSVESLPEEPSDYLSLTQRPLPTPPNTAKLSSPANGRALPVPPCMAPSIASDTEGYETAASMMHPDEDEPTIEELLAASGEMSAPHFGGYAWENAHETLVTMKRVPVPSYEMPTFAEPMPTVKGADGKGSGSRTGSDERVALDDIFTASPCRMSPSRPLPPPPTEPPILDLPATSDKAVATMQVLPDADAREYTQLKANIGRTRNLIEQFKRRLEEVEGKIAAMEERERQNALASQPDTEAREEATVAPTPKGHWLPVLAGWALQKVGLANVLAPPRQDKRKDRSTLYRLEDPTTLRALPPYIFFVGLGVCAVVLRVLLRRVGGKSLLVR
ncbi:hypothetical protein BD626DRAFT_570557 [Schizophyllum amplum]|uniref:SAM domain-containing protein n=1 Tax=Schizophyllum amplum TaxID=97359 RepID=A0A550CAM3_9AGAR|nr:hypothetical protein BD626DRAFT_570557 [Auriculariopsis ampla]